MTYFQKNPLLYKEKPADSVKMNEEFQQVYGILNEMKTEQDSHDIHDATEATTVADNDEFGFVYAVTSVLKKIKWSNIKAVLKTYFDTLYSVLGHTHPGTDVTSAVANATTAASCSGNAATATKLATARTISLTGDVTGSASFDGSANASITATIADDSHNHVISNVDGLQTALDGKPNILSERSLSVTTANWVTIATCSTGRAYGEFYVYDADSSRHNMVKIIASTSYGQNSVVALCGNRFGSRTIAHVRILYNTADRTYGGAKLQVYCENPTFTLRVRRVFTDNLSGWTSWNDVNPVVEGTPSGWAEDSTTRFDDITSTAYSLSGNLSGNATGLKVSTWATVQTDSGNIQFGPANTSWAHIYTDRPNFYFNKPLYVNGTAVSLNDHTHAGTAITSAVANATNAATATNVSGGSVNATTGSFSGLLTANKGIQLNRAEGTSTGINYYSPTYTSWQTIMSPAGTASGVAGNVTSPAGSYVTSWALRNIIEPSAGYGWTWESMVATGTTSAIVAELSSVTGNFKTNGSITANGGFSGNLTGNAATATKLATTRALTIGSTAKNFDGSAAVTWSLEEIGAAASSHTHTGTAITSAVANATNAANLTGFTNSNSANPINGADASTNNAIGYVTNISILGQVDGALRTQAYSSSWVAQIYQDYRTGQMAIRGKNNGTWQAWRTVLDSSNYSSWAAPSSHTHSYAPIPTSSTLPVGTICVCLVTSGSVADGSTISGSSLKIVTPIRNTDGALLYHAGATQSGTWKNIHGGAVGAESTTNTGLFVRTA